MPVYYPVMKSKVFTTRLRWWTGGILVSMALAGGCQDPHYQAKQDMRDQRIQDLLEGYAAREQQGPENLEAIWELVETHELRHARQFDETALLIKEVHLRDQREWLEQAPVRREKVQSIFAGQPNEIPDTWRKMAY